MTSIRSLFDPAKDIYRTIEKVITYNVSQAARLKAEITEYIATDSIENQLERLLTRMQQAMDSGGENEIGVWVSGFYGSGKSSFTKYTDRKSKECIRHKRVAASHQGVIQSSRSIKRSVRFDTGQG